VDANKGTGGYGSLYGPNIDTNGADTLGEGKIAGLEAIAYSGDRSGKRKAVLMVQVPASFDPAQPCIVTATSSGSRGIYGAIGTAGEWGLKHGCAVAYTDKGSGNGMHDLARDTVNLLDGTVASAARPARTPTSAPGCRPANATPSTRASPAASPTSTPTPARTPRRTGAATPWMPSPSPSTCSTRSTPPPTPAARNRA
jgi:hypothetical protein